MKKTNFEKWWTTKRRWHKDVEKYFSERRPERRLAIQEKCYAGIKKMCEAAYKAGRKE